MELDKKVIAERLSSIRKALGITQRQLSASLKISQSSYCEMESGDRLPRFELLYQLASVYRVSMSYVFFGKGAMFDEWSDITDIHDEGFQNNLDFFKSFFEKYRYSMFYRNSIMARHYELSLLNKSTIDEELRRNKKGKQ